MVVDLDGPPCHGQLPEPRLPGGGRVGHRAGRAGGRGGSRRAGPTRRSAARSRTGREITGALVTELAHDGDRGGARRCAERRAALGVGIANVVNIFNPEVIVDRRRRDRAPASCCSSPPREVVAARALPPSRDVVRDRARRGSARSRGCSARRCWRSDARWR